RIRAIKAFRLYPYLQKNLPKQEYFYPLFGLYTIAATYAPLYAMPTGIREQYSMLYKIIYHSVFGITTAFMTYPIWHPRLKSKQLLTWIWPASTFYSLFFVGSMLVIISGFQQVQIMGFMLNLVMAMILMQWTLALCMAL